MNLPRLRRTRVRLGTEISGFMKFLLLTCAAPTHAQVYLVINNLINLNVSPIDAGSQN